MRASGGMADMTLEQKFWSNVTTGNFYDCWEWRAGINSKGYGAFWFNGKTISAHRIAWQITNGKIPEGMCVLHHCDNPRCCNPNHLFIGTHNDNVQDKVNKNRQAKEENNGRSKLTKKDVREIRLLGKTKKYTKAALARQFNISRKQIRNIINYICWK